MTGIAGIAVVLRNALRPHGYDVVELDGWKTRSCGTLAAEAVVWHHDGSGIGASPSIPGYIARQVDAGKPGANIWVGLDGTWHLIAAGLTYHAGKALPGKPGNARSIGVETDHTTGEDIGLDLLASLRIGTAALLAHMGVGPAGGLEFHATVCDPPGRKLDPDGLDLPVEQAAVAALMNGDDDMPRYKDWPVEDKMLLANDVAQAVVALLGEKEPKTLAGERLLKAARAGNG